MRVGVALLVLLVVAVPAMAQDEFPRVEVAMGYANAGLPAITGERHSGFAMHSGFNLTHWLGIENFTGVYSLGNDVTLFSNLFGGKVAVRGGGRIIPYGVAGLGIAYFTNERLGFGFSTFSTRMGGGVDVPINDALGLKFDVSRMFFNERMREGSKSGWNVGVGITLNMLMN